MTRFEGGSYVSDDISIPPATPSTAVQRFRQRVRAWRGNQPPWHHGRRMALWTVISDGTESRSYRCRKIGCKTVRF